MTREAGKGDAPRRGANQEAYSAGWDRIFKNNKTICELGQERKSLEAECDSLKKQTPIAFLPEPPDACNINKPKDTLK